MYVSRLIFHTLPGRTHDVERELTQLQQIVADTCGVRPRILRAHFASMGAADIVFEQEAPDLGTLEREIEQVRNSPQFHQWSGRMTGLLAETPKREVYAVVGSEERTMAGAGAAASAV